MEETLRPCALRRRPVEEAVMSGQYLPRIIFLKLFHLPIMPFPTPEITPEEISNCPCPLLLVDIQTSRNQNVFHLAGCVIYSIELAVPVLALTRREKQQRFREIWTRFFRRSSHVHVWGSRAT